LDAIDPATAGRVRMDRVVEEAGAQVKWAADILKVLNNPSELEHSKPEQEAEKLARKGAPKANFVNSKLRKMFDKLKDIGMMERLEKDDPRLRDGEDENMVASAVMFMVEKLGTECKIMRGGVEVSVPLLRLIADARRANAKLMNNLTYNIFTLDVLFQTVSNVCQRTERSPKKKWYCINADLRHWFHQIPLPEHLRNLFQFRFESGEVYRACLLPMGWFLSPPIAQAITWTLALSTPKDGRVPELSRAQQLNEMPPWLEFDKHAGGIFVIQDNIFIITDDEKLANAWSAHLVERAKHFNAEFKGKGPEVIEISAENGMSVEFNGIEFFYGKWRTAHRQDRAEEFVGDGPYSFTHRKNSRLLGEILWDMRVRQVAGIENEPLMKLFSFNTPPSQDEWDIINKKFARENYDLLKNELTLARHHQFCVCSDEWYPERERTMVYAVDASLGENKERKVLQATIAVVSFNLGAKTWKWENVHKPHVYIGEAE
ncbi:MAG: reverse transcriptase domain-containing protein, partial [Legionella sp.]|nr:reverse transcriptase domain-containing protein [Legionella sp.]